jgi:hypothetical protein
MAGKIIPIAVCSIKKNYQQVHFEPISGIKIKRMKADYQK